MTIPPALAITTFHSEHLILVLGQYLIFARETGLPRQIWSLSDLEEEPEAIHLGAGFVPTCMAHPDTYLNKVRTAICCEPSQRRPLVPFGCANAP